MRASCAHDDPSLQGSERRRLATSTPRGQRGTHGERRADPQALRGRRKLFPIPCPVRSRRLRVAAGYGPGPRDSSQSAGKRVHSRAARRRRGVAQLGSAPASGAGGRRFESSRPDHHASPVPMDGARSNSSPQPPTSVDRGSSYARELASVHAQDREPSRTHAPERRRGRVASRSTRPSWRGRMLSSARSAGPRAAAGRDGELSPPALQAI